MAIASHPEDARLPDGTRLRELRVNTDGVVPSASPLAVRP